MTFEERASFADLFDDEAIAARAAAVGLCRAALEGVAPTARTLVVGLGETSSTMVFASGARPVAFWTVAHAPALEAAIAAADERLCRADGTARVRAAALAAVERARLSAFRGLGCEVVAASRLARALVTMGSDGGDRASLDEVGRATNQLVARSVETRIRGFAGDCLRAFAVGAAILEAVLVDLEAPSVVGPSSLERSRSTGAGPSGQTTLVGAPPPASASEPDRLRTGAWAGK